MLKEKYYLIIKGRDKPIRRLELTEAEAKNCIEEFLSNGCLSKDVEVEIDKTDNFLNWYQKLLHKLAISKIMEYFQDGDNTSKAKQEANVALKICNSTSPLNCSEREIMSRMLKNDCCFYLSKKIEKYF